MGAESEEITREMERHRNDLCSSPAPRPRLEPNEYIKPWPDDPQAPRSAEELWEGRFAVSHIVLSVPSCRAFLHVNSFLHACLRRSCGLIKGEGGGWGEGRRTKKKGRRRGGKPTEQSKSKERTLPRIAPCGSFSGTLAPKASFQCVLGPLPSCIPMGMKTRWNLTSFWLALDSFQESMIRKKCTLCCDPDSSVHLNVI